MKKILRSTWRYIRRSPYQSLAAITVMTLTFFMVSAFLLTAIGSNLVLKYFETRPQVIAFLKSGVTKEDADNLTLKLLATGKIDKVNFVSQEQALDIYREQNKNDPLLLEMVSAEILPASLEISAKDLTFLEPVAELLEAEEQVEEVSFQKDVVKVLQEITTGLERTGLVLILVLLTISFLIVLVIVSMKAAIRRREIRIMQLIGATRWHIRLPFIVEGLFYGMTAAILAWLITYALLWYATPFLAAFLTGISLFPVPVVFMLLLLLGLLTGGVIIGSLGSVIAVRRYLR